MEERRNSRIWWCTVGAIALAALLLRLAESRGGLWTDEAWSAIYAQQARDPIGVFLRINHDNNHHLISLWLQAIGPAAPPWLARLPAVLAGSASVVVAALVVGRKSAAAGIVAALLFAVSPIMVTYGSEARGYAPMVLAALTMLLLVMHSLEEKQGNSMPWWLALAALLGMLSHLTMAAPIVLISLWVYLERRAVEGSIRSLRSTAILMGPAIVIAAAVPVLVFAAGAMSPIGMRVGGYVPFGWDQYFLALGNLSGWTFGLTQKVLWLPLLVAAPGCLLVAVRRPNWLGDRAILYSVLIFGLPAALAVIRSPNIGFARYFLCSSIGLLLLSSEWTGHLLRSGRAARAVAGGALAVVLALSLAEDWALVRIERGHPDEIVRLMKERSPGGARLALETGRLEAVTKVAAVRAGYPLVIVGGCKAAGFAVSSEAWRLSNARAPLKRCGVTMRPIGVGAGTALTGDSWILYRADQVRPAQIASR